MAIAEYTKRAQKAYRERHDRLTIAAPAGTRERIRAVTNLSLTDYIVGLILEDLARKEREKGSG